MKNILIPTDFSDEQKNTIEYGIQLSQFYKCKLTLVKAVVPVQTEAAYMAPTQYAGAMMTETVEMQEIKIEAAEKYFDELLHEYGRKFSFIPEISTKVEIGSEHSVITKMVNQENADFILLPGYGDNNFLEYLNDDRMNIVEDVHVPVLIVPPMADFSNFSRVVYATDYKKEDIKSINQLVEFIKPFRGVINGLHISQEANIEEIAKEEGFERILKERIPYENINIYSISQDKVSDGVLKFAEETNSDLIAVLREDKSFFKRIFDRDKAKKIARKSDLPVLIFHE